MAPTCQYGRCWLADPQGVYVSSFLSIYHLGYIFNMLPQIAYWLSSYPLGKSTTILPVTEFESLTLRS